MIFLPIVERELRVAARRHTTYSTRLLIVLGAIVIGFFLYLAHLRLPVQQLAPRLFIGMSALAMVFCLGAGRLSTADCLSSEKREGTLGLLFLTDLKGYDVVLGKLAATSLSAFYAVLAMVPMLVLIAKTAPRGGEATMFAIMASLMNLALSASQLFTQYLNTAFAVTQQDYSNLGRLMITVGIVGLLPLLALPLLWKQEHAPPPMPDVAAAPPVTSRP